MNNDTTEIKRPQDPSQINLTQSWEVIYWCNAFGITEEKLRKAVAHAGKSTTAVRMWLAL